MHVGQPDTAAEWEDVARAAPSSVLRAVGHGGHPVGVLLRSAGGDLIVPGASAWHEGSTAHPLAPWLAAHELAVGGPPALGRLELLPGDADELAARSPVEAPPTARGELGARVVLGPFVGAPVVPPRPCPAGTLAAEAARRLPPGTLLHLLAAGPGPREVLGTFEVAIDPRARALLLEVPASFGAFLAPLTRVPLGGERAPCRWRAGRGPLASEARPLTRLAPRGFSPLEEPGSEARAAAAVDLLARVGAVESLAPGAALARLPLCDLRLDACAGAIALGGVGDAGDVDLALRVLGGDRWPLRGDPAVGAGGLLARLSLLLPAREAAPWALLERVADGGACLLHGDAGAPPRLWRADAPPDWSGFRSLVDEEGWRMGPWLRAAPGFALTRAEVRGGDDVALRPPPGAARYGARRSGAGWSVVDAVGDREVLSPGPEGRAAADAARLDAAARRGGP